MIFITTQTSIWLASFFNAVRCVAIMTWMSETSADTYGEEAAMHGLNVTFLAMSLSTLALVIIAVFFVPKKDR